MTFTRLPIPAFVLACALLAGCPEPIVEPTFDVPRSDAGTDAASVIDSPSPLDAGLDASVSDTPTSDAPTGGGAGLLSISQGVFSGGAAQHTVFGVFIADASIEDVRRGLFPGCTVSAEVGSCRRLACGAVPELRGAGTLTVTVDEDGATPITVTEPASPPYISSAAGTYFAAGDVLRFTTTGGVVPALTADVVAPASPTVTAPSTLGAGPLVVSWATTDADTAQLTLSGAALGGIVTCLGDASTGTVSIDRSLLGAASSGDTLSLTTSFFSTTTVEAGGYTVDVSVAQGGVATITIE